tara:strand:- start:124 stop:348 length:225 start_codon:yes stop_codon:yes gene_type:complete
MKKYSVKIANHHTSISLEEEFWVLLKKIAKAKGLSLNAIITEIDQQRKRDNLSSAIRVYILNYILNDGPSEVNP